MLTPLQLHANTLCMLSINVTALRTQLTGPVMLCDQMQIQMAPLASAMLQMFDLVEVTFVGIFAVMEPASTEVMKPAEENLL